MDTLIRYEKIGTVDGEDIDLTVTPDSTWTEKSFGSSGIKDGLGKLNAKSKIDSTVKFTFVKSGTTDAVVVPALAMTVYDIDASDDGPEHYTIVGAYDFKTPEGFDEMYTVDKTDTGVNVFALASNIGSGDDNPSLSDLTEDQKKKTVTVFLKDTSDFDVNMFLSGIDSSNGGRNVFFSFTKENADPSCGAEGSDAIAEEGSDAIAE